MKNLIIEFYNTGRMEIWEDKEWTKWELDGDKLAVKKGELIVGLYHFDDICRVVIEEEVDEDESNQTEALPVLRQRSENEHGKRC